MKKNLFTAFLILVGFVFTTNVFGQEVGDYRSFQSGDWGTPATWQRFDGTTWITPTGAPGATNNVEIQSGHTVTIPSSGKNCYNLTVDAGSKLWVGNTSVYSLRINGPTAIINGILGDYSAGDGLILEIYYTSGVCTITGSGVCEPLRIRGGNGKTPINLIIDIDVSLGYQGVALSPLYTTTGTGTLTINSGKTVTIANGGSVSTSGSSVLNDGSTCTFNIDGNIYAPGPISYFNLRSSTICTAVINGSVTFGGTLNSPGSAPPVGITDITINGILRLGWNANNANITVANGGTLDLSNSTGNVLGTGTFTLSSGGTLMIGNADGIWASAAIGNIQSTTRIYSKGANYIYASPGYYSYYDFTGDGLPDTVDNLIINSTNDVILTNGVTVTGKCTINSGSYLVESPGIYVAGITNTTQPVGNGSSTLGGIGVALDAGVDDLGDVTVHRVAGSGSSILGSIDRNWTITSTNPPTNSRNLTLSWDPLDDNGKDLTTAQVWRSTNNGSSWFTVGSSQDASGTHSITIATNSFSLWTVSDETNPLPVELTSFTANEGKTGIEIKWTTATETNNYGWDIEMRKSSETSWEKIGFVNGTGNSNSPKEYSFVDKSVKRSGLYSYRLKQIDLNGNFSYSNEVTIKVEIPLAYSLEQNYPNPFNPSTSIQYAVDSRQLVTLKVYDVLGREVATLVNEEKEPGIYRAEFNTQDYQLASGIYLYRIQSGKFVETKKMVLMK